MYLHRTSSPDIGALEYLLSNEVGKEGIFPGFPRMTRGPSDAWTTGCVVSALYEITKNPQLPAIIRGRDALIRLRRKKDGGWAYNHTVRSDPDSTARVIQCFQKIGYHDQEIYNGAFSFIMSHQEKPTGGIMTYAPENLAEMRKLDNSRGYPGGGWDKPHACVSALVYNILPDGYPGKNELRLFLLKNHEPYWWVTEEDGTWKPLTNYVRYETRNLIHRVMLPPGENPVDMGLYILGLNGKGREFLHGENQELLRRLLKMQLADGSFPSSAVFHLPPSNFPPGIIPSTPRVIEDSTRLFSTAAAGVAAREYLSLYLQILGS